MNIQDLKITAGQMRSLIIAMINVNSQDSKTKSKSLTKTPRNQIKVDTKYEVLPLKAARRS